jgi:hypothetical protein
MAFAGDGIDHQREGHRARFSTERIEHNSATDGRI